MANRHTKSVLKDYDKARQVVDDLMTQLTAAKVNQQIYGDELMEAMKRDGFKTVKTTDGKTATIAIRNSIFVKDTMVVEEWLDKNPDIDKNEYVRIDLPRFKNLAEAKLNQTGELLPGTELKKTEYLALRRTEGAKNGRE